MRRDRFHRERGADPPLATHRDAVKRAKHEKDRQVWREAGRKLDEGIEQNIDHQSGPPPPAVSGTPEEKGSDGPHRQRQQDGEGNFGNLGIEFMCDVLEHEHQEEEVEGVERPSEKARDDDAPLFACPPAQRREPHLCLPSPNLKSKMPAQLCVLGSISEASPPD